MERWKPAPLEANSVREDIKFVRHLLHLGLLCCQPSPESRPSIQIVKQMLQSDGLDALPALPTRKPSLWCNIRWWAHQHLLMMSPNLHPKPGSRQSCTWLCRDVLAPKQCQKHAPLLPQVRCRGNNYLGHSTHRSSSSTFVSSNNSTSSSSQMEEDGSNLARTRGLSSKWYSTLPLQLSMMLDIGRSSPYYWFCCLIEKRLHLMCRICGHGFGAWHDW